MADLERWSPTACTASCKALGVRIALDDFGTGLSSLRYLQQAAAGGPEDPDRAFVAKVGEGVAGAGRDPPASRAGSACSTVAEGIETEEQLAAVRALGCDHGQGYLFSRPLTETAAAAHLAVSRSSGRRSFPGLR